MVSTGLPVAKRACKECPFRRASARGWLGGGDHGTPEAYARLAHSDINVPCHLSPGFPSGDEENMRPCTGLAQYRKHVCKNPRDPLASKACGSVSEDRETIFTSPAEFIKHHTLGST